MQSLVYISNVTLVHFEAKMPGVNGPACVPVLSLNFEIERMTDPSSSLTLTCCR